MIFRRNKQSDISNTTAPKFEPSSSGVRPIRDGGANPIVKEQPYDPKNPPINDGTFFSDKAIFQEMPFGVNNGSQSISYTGDFNEHDDKFTPNLFGTWSDIYGAFCGSFQLVEAPDEIKRHESTMLHMLFILGRFALMRVDNKRWLIGNYSIEKCDEYGRVTSGEFIPWNHSVGEPDKDKTITITEQNRDLFVNMQYGTYSIPPFIIIGYFINFRNMLYQFKNVNLRMATIHKIIGLKSKGKKVLKKYLDQLFNLDSKTFPAPIQVMDISVNEGNGDMAFNFTDLNNQIDFKVEYKGNEINLDIDSLTKELFRVAGIRYDTSASSGTFQDRPSKAQTKEASSYFDDREMQHLRYFRNFEYDFKEKFGMSIKWDTTHNISETKNKEQERENEDENDNI